MRAAALLLLLPALLCACSVLPSVSPYRIEIQQGNYISQEAVAKLKLGMTREQVRFALGTPLITDIFHADHWDYIHYREISPGKSEKRRISVFFEQDRLARVTGDVVPAGGVKQATEAAAPDAKN